MDKGLIQEKRSNLRQNTLTAVATVLLSLLVLGFAFPGYASQVPFIGGIFGMFENPHRDYSLLQEVANKVGNEVSIVGLPDADITVSILEDGMIEIVNETDGTITIMDRIIHNVVNETDGMSVTIKEVVFDGQVVYFAYHVETDRALEVDEHFRISSPELWVDGVDVIEDQGYGGSPGALQRISEHNYIAIGILWLPVLYEIVEYADLYFTLGNWRVGFPIEKINSEIILLNETVHNESFEATVTRVMTSPIGGLVYFSYVQPPEYASLGWEFFVSSPVPDGVEANFGIMIRDNLGNELSGGISMSSSDEGGSGFVELITPLCLDATELIITPFMYVHHWYLGDWRHTLRTSVGADEVIAGGGSVETRKVILGEIVVPLR